MSGLTVERLAELRREVREWMCDECNTVYPGPPQPGIWCVQCPRCGGDTAPRDTIERRRLEREVEQLQRTVGLEGLRLIADVLRGLEWSGWDERFRAHMCPVCGGYKRKNKHFPDCDLNKALSFLRGVPDGPT